LLKWAGIQMVSPERLGGLAGMGKMGCANKTVGMNVPVRRIGIGPTEHDLSEKVGFS
jgi:hypothetical protein